MNLNFYLYETVKVIKIGKIGMIIDVNSTEDKLLVEFPDGKREWCYERDVLLIEEEEC